ncbi:MAG: NDP-sugar synthase [Lentisphaerae bacterium]|nr:NDP-sugar synthase [Lentisphaerota bacterium]MCP4103599.1 NDP-sugar synthase [Lentisphaerota bacterium]
MKCIINCSETGTAWTNNYFVGLPAYMLPVANKPFLEYLVEFCSLAGADEIRIVLDNPDISLEKYFDDGSKWNLKITYNPSSGRSSIQDAMRHNSGMLDDGKAMILNGYFFLEHDKNTVAELFNKIKPGEKIVGDDGCGIYLLDRKMLNSGISFDSFKEVAIDGIKPHLLRDIKDFYDLNMAIVKGHTGKYIMPSYSSEEGVYIGQDVEITQSCEVKKPIILGSHIRLKSNSKIGPLAIIGNNSLIDSRTVVERSVVMGSSYIGTDLEIKDKIIHRNRIINPENGEILDIVDEFLISEIRGGIIRRFLASILYRLTAIIIMLVQLPFFLLIRHFVKIKCRSTECWGDRMGMTKIKFELYPDNAFHFIDRWFLKLSLDKFHLLPKVISGKMRLAGNCPSEANDLNLHFIGQMPNYCPAVFPYSAMLNHEADEFQEMIDELYYAHHAGIWLNINIVFKTLISNLLKQF